MKAIKYCAVTLVLFILGAEGYFFAVQRAKEDIAGGVALGLIIIFLSTVIATAAGVFEKTLQSAVNLQSRSSK